MIIKYLKHNEIDKTKWDYCVENSINCMIYGMSWYLDVVCENWDALVTDDYEAVMPLPWKSKLGIKYIYHPFFAQQLGVFYQNPVANKFSDFINEIPTKFLKYEISANHLNQVKSISSISRTNYVLNLNLEYIEISSCFNENTKRNIKKGVKNNPIINEDISIDEFLNLKKQNSVIKLTANHYKTLHQLIKLLINKKHAKIIGITNSENNILGAALFVSFKNRIIYLFSASSEAGKNQSVMFTLVNKVINENAGQNKFLDFEGSMIEGVARFFMGFGSVNEKYYRIKKSRIPFI